MKYKKPELKVISDKELKEHIIASASSCYYVCCTSGK